MLATEGFTPEEREPFLRIAAAQRRPRHLILLETARENVAEDDLAPLNELRRALDAGELGNEGIQTALRLGGGSAAEVKRILFRPPAARRRLASSSPGPSPPSPAGRLGDPRAERAPLRSGRVRVRTTIASSKLCARALSSLNPRGD